MKKTYAILISILFLSSGPMFAEELFNGKNLNGWVIENDGKFSVKDNKIHVNKGVGWLRSEKQYANFVLTIEFRFLEKGANSGIFIRTGPTSKKDENGWPDNGYQVQCKDTIEPPALGMMIPYGAPPFKHKSDLDAIKKEKKAPGEWQTFEITCQDETMTVKLNGTVITTCTEIKNLKGHIGIQGEKGLLEFRKLTIAEK